MDHTPELGGHSAPTAASASGTMLPTPWRIETVHRETSDTFTLTLAPAAGVAAVRFAPGQFNMLYVFGVGEVPISISGDPAEVSALTHTTRAVGTVTQAMRRLAPGAALGVRGPFGVSWPMEFAKGRDVLLVAGGLGLAPLRPALYHLLAHRADYGRVAPLGHETGPRSASDGGSRSRTMAWQRRCCHQAHPARPIRPVENRGDGDRPGGDDAVHGARIAEAGRPARADLPLPGAQYAMRRRLLRPLPVWAVVRLQRRPGLSL